MIAANHAADGLGVAQLRSFCLVYERQSYAAAASDLGLAVPTIWEQVRTLEKRYGTRLFTRRGRRIEPTPAAAVLYQSLSSLLAGIDSTLELLREQGGERPPAATVVDGGRMMLEDLGRPLARFRKQHPGVCLRLLHEHDKAAEELIVSGEADLALTLEAGPGVVGRGVASERAYQIDYLALFPKRHPLTRKLSLDLKDLASYPLIIGHARTYGRQLLEQALHHAGLLDRIQIVA